MSNFVQFQLASNQFKGPDASEQFWQLLSDMSGSVIKASHPAGSDPQDFHYKMEIVAWTGCVMSITSASPVRFDTSPAKIEEEQIVFQLPIDRGQLFVEQRREIYCAPGMGLVALNTERQIAGLATTARNISLSIPFKTVRDYLKKAELPSDRTIAPDDPYAKVLRDYCLSVHGNAKEMDIQRRGFFSRQLSELAALVLGASTDGHYQAVRNALPDARLEIAKSFIRRSLGDVRLDDEMIGRNLGVSAPVVRRIFHGAGLSVSGYIRDARLDRANAMLGEPLYRGLRIIEISHLCGFQDISTFNRAFRRKFGVTPKDIRQTLGPVETMLGG